MFLAEVFALQVHLFAHLHQAGKNTRTDFVLQSVAGAGIGKTHFVVAFIFAPDAIIQLVFEVGGDQCHLVIIVVAGRDEMIENGQFPVCVSAFGQLINHQYLDTNIRINEFTFRDILSISSP